MHLLALVRFEKEHLRNVDEELLQVLRSVELLVLTMQIDAVAVPIEVSHRRVVHGLIGFTK